MDGPRRRLWLFAGPRAAAAPRRREFAPPPARTDRAPGPSARRSRRRPTPAQSPPGERPAPVSREFTIWATSRTSPVVSWLRALAAVADCGLWV